ncbi:hydrogen peroxide-dependent heme synthase [Patulibacter defluvii]|uniref:hydrogen peroxide-dependent heme synthase n=1 Tax=Patulibacter defluvii TaxID=3095358 RepID=UPI002A751118|nr:hydrogen peroxide-dependent heme synthase [Patulibacter sp. DM4]
MSTQTDFTNLYAIYASFKAARGHRRVPNGDPALRAELAAEAEAALTGGEAILRGSYSTVGFRAETDVLLWMIGPSADALQDALVAFNRTRLGQALDPWWTSIGVHREAEFNKAHVPAYLEGTPARKYISVYPFVRSLEWYLLAPDERSAMLREHGMMAAGFKDVRANTISAFALNDYEWLLAFEADELTRIVDLMRELRGARARAHMREELPFLTGIRKSLAEVVADLP